MCLGVRVNREKIGNLMVYLATKITPIFHTQLIKLIYLIDEEAVKDDGVPVTWLDYKAWQYGPVAPETYYIKCGGITFSDFVSVMPAENNTYHILPKVAFSDKKFSDYDMELIDRMIEKYKDTKPCDLVKLTHEKDTLWDITCKENNIIFDKDYRISDYSLDFKKLINEDIKMENYIGALDTMMFNYQLQGC